MTQCERIVKYCQDFGSITAVEAMQELGVMRLASRIHDLKVLGYDVTDETVSSKNRWGEPVSYKRYYVQ